MRLSIKIPQHEFDLEGGVRIFVAYSELVSHCGHVSSSGVQSTSTPPQPASSLSSNAPSSQPPPLLHHNCPAFASGFDTNPHCKHVFVLCVSGLQLGNLLHTSLLLYDGITVHHSHLVSPPPKVDKAVRNKSDVEKKKFIFLRALPTPRPSRRGRHFNFSSLLFLFVNIIILTSIRLIFLFYLETLSHSL